MEYRTYRNFYEQKFGKEEFAKIDAVMQKYLGDKKDIQVHLMYYPDGQHIIWFDRILERTPDGGRTTEYIANIGQEGADGKHWELYENYSDSEQNHFGTFKTLAGAVRNFAKFGVKSTTGRKPLWIF